MENKILLDNIIFKLQTIGGISNYWFNLLKRFVENNNIFYLEDNHLNKNYYRNLIKLSDNLIIQDKRKMPLIIKRYLPLRNIDGHFDIFHSSYYRYSKGNIKNVTTVHDFLYERYISKNSLRRVVHSLQKYLAIKHSDYIIGVSKNTLDDMLKYFPEFKNKKMQVIYLGTSDDFYPLKNKSKSIKIQDQELFYSGYFFYFGNRNGYKNFKLLIEAFSNLLKNNKNIPKLVIAGGGEFSSQEKIFLSESKILSNLVKINKITNSELNLLYNYCIGFIYPSLYEGFGLPLLEAMQAGAPVICSDSSSIPEVVGKAAIYINPLDVFSLEKALLDLLDRCTRKDMANMGYKQAEKFSWRNTYKETLEVYNSLR
jgi:mannosyltransferase